MDKAAANILIVGGSLSGLIHGVLLKRQGHSVRILERSSTPIVGTQGAGLNAGPDVQRFMQEFDRTGLPYSLHPPKAHIINSASTTITTMESDQWSTDWSTLYYRLRANFDGFQSEYCDVFPEIEGEGQGIYMDEHSVTGVQYEHGHLTAQYNTPQGLTGSFDADLLIVADGSSSKVRQIFAPEVEQKYVGYCGWRGTVPEEAISNETKAVLNENITVCGIDKSFLTSLQPGSRYYNWVWYRKYLEGSGELQELLTDKEGRKHRSTLPARKMSERSIQEHKALAHQLLAPCTAELVSKTDNTFIQVINDVISPNAVFLDGKALLVGDALATFRPMTGLGTNQAARQALSLLEVLRGRLSMGEWERNSLEYAQATRSLGIERERLFNLG